jgi:hypothetical protein
MITYIRLSADKNYLIIDVNTESALTIQLEGDVVISTYDNKIEYRFTETKCRIVLIQDSLSTSNHTFGRMEIYSDSMSYCDSYENEPDDDVLNTMEGILSKAIDLYKQERLIKTLARFSNPLI